MALVAGSLADERVEHAKASAIMARIYDVSESERGKAMMDEILQSAYTRNGASAGGSAPGGAPGRKFAEELFTTCMKSGGDMEGVLGRRS